ncbi:sigma-54 interaction domain-containing protein [Alkalihalobacterium bogoriense]|uniref:sigma-54 interaction domain-containing protein n=1 Tax=Alkalihalobacterium bogoriense TaxID=246272 RepID=UPI00054E9491|nr:sigma 54-interacting transcriptional regulator [Alkalihalobacterium bogoriense]
METEIVIGSEQLKQVIEFSSDGIYVVNQDGITILVNQAYETMTGLSREHLLGKHMSELIQEGKINESVSLLVLKKKKTISLVQQIANKKDMIVTGNPVFKQDGEIDFVVTSVRDITQLAQLKNELHRAKAMSLLQNNQYTFLYGEQNERYLFKGSKMRVIYDQIKHVAPFPTSILLQGPTGTGKEVLANLIHHTSNRQTKPFIKINCGAIPDHLLESELFGYEAGAFTGAKKEGKIGVLELANKGTILLDEIGEMPLAMQVKLLRVLQEKKVQRIGGTKEYPIDVRIISATNRNIKQQILEKQFREDLYYRLAVVTIDIPPLCERQDELHELILYFFEAFCQRYHLTKTISDDALEILTTYHWPGNVRQVKNTIENLLVSVSEDVITKDHLFFFQSDIHPIRPVAKQHLKEQMEQAEKQIISAILKQAPSIRQAARELGIHHATLLAKMKRYNLLHEKT